MAIPKWLAFNSKTETIPLLFAGTAHKKRQNAERDSKNRTRFRIVGLEKAGSSENKGDIDKLSRT